MTRTSSAWVVFGARRALTASSLPLPGDVVGLHPRQRCAQTPSPIAGVKLLTRDARRELYDMFGNIVGSVTIPPCGVPTDQSTVTLNFGLVECSPLERLCRPSK